MPDPPFALAWPHYQLTQEQARTVIQYPPPPAAIRNTKSEIAELAPEHRKDY